MLTVVPPNEDRQLLATVEHVRSYWPGWDRFLVGWCALFHLAMAAPLAFAPVEQIINAGTQPVFDLAGRYVWALVFLTAGVLAAAALRWPSLQLAAWLTVFGVGGLWLTAFALAVLNDRGSAIGVTVWPFLYGPWAVAAVRMALGKR